MAYLNTMTGTTSSTVISHELIYTTPLYATTCTTPINYKIRIKVKSTTCSGSTSTSYYPATWERTGLTGTTICTNSWGGTDSICTYEYNYGDDGFIECANWNDWRAISHECYKPKTIKEKLNDIIKNRCAPNIITSRKSLVKTEDIREQRARETLKRVIGENKFINFIKNGFITIKAKSGLVYQIFPGHGVTAVYNKGQMVERLCVVLQGNFPPTDSLIMRFLLILNNEEQFRSFAIKHSLYNNKRKENITENKSLVELFRELKSA